MTKPSLRSMVMDDESYLWALKSYEDIWAGKLVVYSAYSKTGQLEVSYKAEEYFAWSKNGQIVDEHETNRVLNIHEPEPASRIIRYARRELAWNPHESKSPLIIEDGFELLKKLGYVTRPIKIDG